VEGGDVSFGDGLSGGVDLGCGMPRRAVNRREASHLALRKIIRTRLGHAKTSVNETDHYLIAHDPVRFLVEDTSLSHRDRVSIITAWASCSDISEGRSMHGGTVAHCAAREKDDRLVRAWADAGGDLTVVDGANRSYLQYCPNQHMLSIAVDHGVDIQGLPIQESAVDDGTGFVTNRLCWDDMDHGDRLAWIMAGGLVLPVLKAWTRTEHELLRSDWYEWMVPMLHEPRVQASLLMTMLFFNDPIHAHHPCIPSLRHPDVQAMAHAVIPSIEDPMLMATWVTWMDG
jgi:hypothetical protein